MPKQHKCFSQGIELMGLKFKVSVECVLGPKNLSCDLQLKLQLRVGSFSFMITVGSLNHIYTCDFVCLATLVLVSHIVSGISKTLDKKHCACINITCDFILKILN